MLAISPSPRVKASTFQTGKKEHGRDFMTVLDPLSNKSRLSPTRIHRLP